MINSMNNEHRDTDRKYNDETKKRDRKNGKCTKKC